MLPLLSVTVWLLSWFPAVILTMPPLIVAPPVKTLPVALPASVRLPEPAKMIPVLVTGVLSLTSPLPISFVVMVGAAPPSVSEPLASVYCVPLPELASNRSAPAVTAPTVTVPTRPPKAAVSFAFVVLLQATSLVRLPA